MSDNVQDVATRVDGNGMPDDACAPPGSGGVGWVHLWLFRRRDFHRRQSALPPLSCLLGMSRLLAPDARRGVAIGSHVAPGFQA